MGISPNIFNELGQMDKPKT